MPGSLLSILKRKSFYVKKTYWCTRVMNVKCVSKQYIVFCRLAAYSGVVNLVQYKN